MADKILQLVIQAIIILRREMKQNVMLEKKWHTSSCTFVLKSPSSEQIFFKGTMITSINQSELIQIEH